MKIMHITFSSEGGAAVGIKRLHNSLLKKKIKSEIFFFKDYLNYPKSIKMYYKWNLIIFFKRLVLKFLTFRNNKESLSINIIDNLNINSILKKNKIDIVHLHWIGNEMISIKQITNIQKPVVWTFHDMWPFVGAEHFCYDKRFLNQYRPTTRSKGEHGIDLDRIVWKEKQKYFPNKNFYITVPSKWMMKNVVKSKLFVNSNKIILPYILDLKKWKKIKILKKKKSKIKLLFVASSSVNFRKGFNYLFDAINKHLDKDLYSLLVVGEKPKKFDLLEIEKEFLPMVKNENKMLKIFNSSDIFVLPSLVESFGQVYIEAGAVGVPSIAFDKTAAAEIIVHKKNGYLAKYKSSKDLAKGIIWARKSLLDKNSRENIRNIIFNKFSAEQKISDYINIYKSLYSQSKKFY